VCRSLVLLVGAAACGRAPAAFGPTVAAARGHSADFFGGLAVRFQDVQRTPKFAGARAKLGRNALNPSRLVGDTAVWTTASSDGTRMLELEGRKARFVLEKSEPPPGEDGRLKLDRVFEHALA